MIADRLPRGARDGERGFTLVEILFALGVLVFGVTSLIGVLSVGVSTRRTAEARSQAALLVDEVVYEIENEILANVRTAGEFEDDEFGGIDYGELEIDPVENRTVESYPGLKYSVRFTVDEQFPWLVLATVDISWLEQGRAVAQTFHRLLNRERPFSQRVEARRQQLNR